MPRHPEEISVIYDEAEPLECGVGVRGGYVN